LHGGCNLIDAVVMPNTLMQTLPPTPHGLYERFLEALEQMQDKLVHLLANSPLLLVAVLIVLGAFWLGGVISRRMRVLTRISRSNPYMDGLLRSTVRSLIGLAGVLVALDILNATSLVGAVLGSAGVVGLVLGFAFKDIAENYIAGVLLSLRQPFAPGDSVRIDSYEGKIIALNSRTTILMTGEGNHLQLPNSLVFKSVLLNYSRNPQRRILAHRHGHRNCGIGDG
jgi:small-conductance mechanosensitive channel